MFGVAECSPDETREHWIQRADGALFKARLNGRNRVEVAAEPSPRGGEDDPWPLLHGLHDFWRTGRGWFSASRGRPSRACAERVLTELSRELAGFLAGRTDTELGAMLGGCYDPDVPRRLDLLLAEGQEALILAVNPAVVLDRLATRAYLWLRR